MNKILYLILIFATINLVLGDNSTNGTQLNNTGIDINQVIFTSKTCIGDIITVLLIFIISIATTISGVGGGSVFVSLFVLINDFSIGVAIPLSVSTILGSTIVRMIYFFNKKHPEISGRNLIYYFPILIIVPLIVNSSFIGIIFSDLFPKIIVFIVIILLLGYTFVKTSIDGIKKLWLNLTYPKIKGSFGNSNSNVMESDVDEISCDLELLIIDNYNNEAIVEEKNISNQNQPPIIEIDGLGISIKTSNRIIHRKAKDNIGKNIVACIVLLFTTIIATAFSIGRSYFVLCSWQFLVLAILQIILFGIICLLICIGIKIDIRNRIINNYLITESDILFNFKSIFKLVVISILTGIMATYIGIGGGSLIVPLLIHMGISPMMVVATGSVTAFFTSLVSTINYIIQLRLLWIYALVYNIFSISGSIIGIFILHKLKKKYQPITIIFTSAIILASIVILIVNLFLKEGLDIFYNISFNKIC